MHWQPLTGIPSYTFLDGALESERKRLEKDLKKVVSLRAAADALADNCRNDRWADRGPWLAKQVAAVEAEIAHREALCLFHSAVEIWISRRREAVRVEILEVELAARARLGVPDEIQVPAAVLQNDPAWWACRAKLNRLPGLSGNASQQRENEFVNSAGQYLSELRKAVRAEPGRLKALAAAQEADVHREHQLIELEERRLAVRDSRLEAIERLLA